MSDQVGGLSEAVQAGHSSRPETIGISTTTLQVPDVFGEPSQTFPKNPEHVETNLPGAIQKARGAAVAWDSQRYAGQNHDPDDDGRPFFGAPGIDGRHQLRPPTRHAAHYRGVHADSRLRSSPSRL